MPPNGFFSERTPANGSPVIGYVFSINRRPAEPGAQPTPSNMSWGATELAEMGYRVRHFYPSSHAGRSLARWRFGAYFLFLIKARRELAGCDVLYISAYNAILAFAMGKFLGLVRPELLVVLGAVHMGKPRGGWRRPWLRLLDRWALQKPAVSLYLTKTEAAVARDYLSLGQDKLDWIRFGVDAAFYEESSEPRENYIIAVGNDLHRDWQAFCRIADLLPGVSFKVLTQNAEISRLSFPRNVEVCRGWDLARSKTALARARALLLTTKPNIHFSGMTTVMNAMLIGTPVVLDEADALPDYFLQSEINCLTFERGNAPAAANCLRRLLDDAGLWSRIRSEGLLLRAEFGMKVFASALSERIERIVAARRSRAPALDPASHPANPA